MRCWCLDQLHIVGREHTGLTVVLTNPPTRFVLVNNFNYTHDSGKHYILCRPLTRGSSSSSVPGKS